MPSEGLALGFELHWVCSDDRVASKYTVGVSKNQGVIGEVPLAEQEPLEVRISNQHARKTPRKVESTGTGYSHLEARSRRHEGESGGVGFILSPGDSPFGSGAGLREVWRCRLLFRAAQSPKAEFVEGP